MITFCIVIHTCIYRVCFLPQKTAMEDRVKLHTNGRVLCAANTAVNGDIFRFKGGSNVGLVKFLEPMSHLLNYFEYLITDGGESAYIGIGVGKKEYPLNRMPGWNANSIGYHADDGSLFCGSGFGQVFGPTCSTGDRMGCGVDFDADCGDGYVHVFFTKNGYQVGSVVRMKLPPGGVYPLVGMHSCGEKVRYLGHWKRLPDGKSKHRRSSEHDRKPGTISVSDSTSIVIGLFLSLKCS